MQNDRAIVFLHFWSTIHRWSLPHEADGDAHHCLLLLFHKCFFFFKRGKVRKYNELNRNHRVGLHLNPPSYLFLLIPFSRKSSTHLGMHLPQILKKKKRKEQQKSRMLWGLMGRAGASHSNIVARFIYGVGLPLWHWFMSTGSRLL